MTIPNEELTLNGAPSFVKLPPGAIMSHAGAGEMLRFNPNGDCFVRGEKVESNVEIWKAVTAWMAACGMPHQRTCPLCRGALVEVDIETNNKIEFDVGGEPRGVLAGEPSMKAVCANGCRISVAASKTGDALRAKPPIRYEPEPESTVE